MINILDPIIPSSPKRRPIFLNSACFNYRQVLVLKGHWTKLTHTFILMIITLNNEVFIRRKIIKDAS